MRAILIFASACIGVGLKSPQTSNVIQTANRISNFLNHSAPAQNWPVPDERKMARVHS